MFGIVRSFPVYLCSDIFRISKGFMIKELSYSTSITGLSEKVFNVRSGDVGPGASKDGKYKNPEYFSYNKISYFEAEIELLKYRLPQPDSTKKQ